MIQSLKLLLPLLYRHREAYVWRSLLLQFFLTVVGLYGLTELFHTVLFLANQQNLTKDNMVEFFLHPLPLVGVICYFLLLVFLIYLEFFALVTIVQARSNKLSLSLSGWSVFWERFRNLIKGGQLVAVLLYLLLTIPVSGLFLTSSLVKKLYIPYFITDELAKTPKTAGLLMLAYALIIYLNFRLIYTLPLTVLGQGKGFIAHLKESWQLTKGKFLRVMWQLCLFGLPLFVIILLFLLGLSVLMSLPSLSLLPKPILVGLVVLLNAVSFSLTELVKLGMVAYMLSHLGYLQLEAPTVKSERKHRYYWGALLMFLLVGVSRSLDNLDRLSYNPYNKDVLTIAHRGNTQAGVANSLEALEGAAAAGAEMVEIDILLTADQQFVVSHDNDLKRLAGLDSKVSQMTLAELEALTIRQGDFTSRLSSLDNYVKRAKELKVNLMVELKPHGQEPAHYAQLVVDKWRQLGLSKKDKVMSLNLQLIEEIERLAPDLETGYVIPLQLGFLAGEQVDFLLIEDFSYIDRLVWEAKFYNQDLYVWTINREEQMRSYLQRPIAGMITDKPDLVQSTKTYFEEHKDAFNRLLQLLD